MDAHVRIDLRVLRERVNRLHDQVAVIGGQRLRPLTAHGNLDALAPLGGNDVDQ